MAGIQKTLDAIYNQDVQEYYTGNNTDIFFNNIYVEECTSFGFRSVVNSSPVYPYNSELFNSISQGNFRIEGRFTVNFISNGYVEHIIQKGNQDKVNGTFTPLGRLSPLDTGTLTQSSEGVLNLNDPQFINTSIFDPRATSLSDSEREQSRAKLRDYIWGYLAVEEDSFVESVRSVLAGQYFDILMLVGNPNSDSYDVKNFVDCQIIDVSMEVVKNMPLQLSYTFIARDMDRPGSRPNPFDFVQANIPSAKSLELTPYEFLQRIIDLTEKYTRENIVNHHLKNRSIFGPNNDPSNDTSNEILNVTMPAGGTVNGNIEDGLTHILKFIPTATVDSSVLRFRKPNGKFIDELQIVEMHTPASFMAISHDLRNMLDERKTVSVKSMFDEVSYGGISIPAPNNTDIVSHIVQIEPGERNENRLDLNDGANTRETILELAQTPTSNKELYNETGTDAIDEDLALFETFSIMPGTKDGIYLKQSEFPFGDNITRTEKRTLRLTALSEEDPDNLNPTGVGIIDSGADIDKAYPVGTELSLLDTLPTQDPTKTFGTNTQKAIEIKYKAYNFDDDFFKTPIELTGTQINADSTFTEEIEDEIDLLTFGGVVAEETTLEKLGFPSTALLGHGTDNVKEIRADKEGFNVRFIEGNSIIPGSMLIVTIYKESGNADNLKELVDDIKDNGSYYKADDIKFYGGAESFLKLSEGDENKYNYRLAFSDDAVHLIIYKVDYLDILHDISYPTISIYGPSNNYSIGIDWYARVNKDGVIYDTNYPKDSINVKGPSDGFLIDDNQLVDFNIGGKKWHYNSLNWVGTNTSNTDPGAISLTCTGTWTNKVGVGTSGEKTMFVPYVTGEHIESPETVYHKIKWFYDPTAWEHAFLGNNSRIVITTNGNVFKDSISEQNLVNAGDGKIGIAGGGTGTSTEYESMIESLITNDSSIIDSADAKVTLTLRKEDVDTVGMVNDYYVLKEGTAREKESDRDYDYATQYVNLKRVTNNTPVPDSTYEFKLKDLDSDESASNDQWLGLALTVMQRPISRWVPIRLNDELYIAASAADPSADSIGKLTEFAHHGNSIIFVNSLHQHEDSVTGSADEFGNPLRYTYFPVTDNKINLIQNIPSHMMNFVGKLFWDSDKTDAKKGFLMMLEPAYTKKAPPSTDWASINNIRITEDDMDDPMLFTMEANDDTFGHNETLEYVKYFLSTSYGMMRGYFYKNLEFKGLPYLSLGDVGKHNDLGYYYNEVKEIDGIEVPPIMALPLFGNNTKNNPDKEDAKALGYIDFELDNYSPIAMRPFGVTLGSINPVEGEEDNWDVQDTAGFLMSSGDRGEFRDYFQVNYILIKTTQEDNGLEPVDALERLRKLCQPHRFGAKFQENIDVATAHGSIVCSKNASFMSGVKINTIEVMAAPTNGNKDDEDIEDTESSMYYPSAFYDFEPTAENGVIVGINKSPAGGKSSFKEFIFNPLPDPNLVKYYNKKGKETTAPRTIATEPILFDSNKSTFKKDGDGKVLSSTTNAIDAVLKELSDVSSGNNILNELTIVGHTDSDGSRNDNVTLSNNRAIAVKAALLNPTLAGSLKAAFTGDASKIITSGKGETQLIAVGPTLNLKSQETAPFPEGSNPEEDRTNPPNTALNKAANRRVEFTISSQVATNEAPPFKGVAVISNWIPLLSRPDDQFKTGANVNNVFDIFINKERLFLYSTSQEAFPEEVGNDIASIPEYQFISTDISSIPHLYSLLYKDGKRKENVNLKYIGMRTYSYDEPLVGGVVDIDRDRTFGLNDSLEDATLEEGISNVREGYQGEGTHITDITGNDIYYDKFVPVTILSKSTVEGDNSIFLTVANNVLTAIYPKAENDNAISMFFELDLTTTHTPVINDDNRAQLHLIHQVDSRDPMEAMRDITQLRAFDGYRYYLYQASPDLIYNTLKENYSLELNSLNSSENEVKMMISQVMYDTVTDNMNARQPFAESKINRSRIGTKSRKNPKLDEATAEQFKRSYINNDNSNGPFNNDSYLKDKKVSSYLTAKDDWSTYVQGWQIDQTRRLDLRTLSLKSSETLQEGVGSPGMVFMVRQPPEELWLDIFEYAGKKHNVEFWAEGENGSQDGNLFGVENNKYLDFKMIDDEIRLSSSKEDDWNSVLTYILDKGDEILNANKYPIEYKEALNTMHHDRILLNFRDKLGKRQLYINYDFELQIIHNIKELDTPDDYTNLALICLDVLEKYKTKGIVNKKVQDRTDFNDVPALYTTSDPKVPKGKMILRLKIWHDPTGIT